MNLLKIIIVVGCGMMLLACGGENKKSVENVENGVPKTEDGRILLSSESEGLIVPEGPGKGVLISSQKLGNAIAYRFNSVSEVFDISFVSEFYFLDALLGLPALIMYEELGLIFTVSFSVRTTKGSVYRGIECRASVNDEINSLILNECSSDRVVLSTGKNIKIYLPDITMENARIGNKEYFQ